MCRSCLGELGQRGSELRLKYKTEIIGYIHCITFVVYATLFYLKLSYFCVHFLSFYLYKLLRVCEVDTILYLQKKYYE